METVLTEIPVLRKSKPIYAIKTAPASSCCAPKDNASVCCTPSQTKDENSGSCCAQPEDGSSCCNK